MSFTLPMSFSKSGSREKWLRGASGTWQLTISLKKNRLTLELCQKAQVHINIIFPTVSKRQRPTFGENLFERTVLLFGRESSLHGNQVQIE